MKSIISYIFIFCLSVFALSANNANLLFQQGTDAYNNGHYEIAVKSFRQLAEQKYQNSDMYYNLGNSYYRLGEFANAVWCYEKALLLNPSNKDAEFNLSFLNNELFAGTNSVPPSFFKEVWKYTYSIISPGAWFVIFLVFQLILPFLILLFFFSAQQRRRRLFFYFSTIALFVYLLSFNVSAWAFHSIHNPSKAVIKSMSVSVRSEPSSGGTDIVAAEQSTTVQILGSSDEWIKIELPDGTQGWILSENTLNLNRDLP